MENGKTRLTLQLGTPEIFDDIFPVRRVFISAEIGLELAAENLQCGTLSDTVGTHKAQHLTGPRRRQSVELEAVGGVSVGDLGFEVGGQVDDGNGVERALLGADTTTNAKTFGDEGNFGFRADFNAELATANDLQILG